MSWLCFLTISLLSLALLNVTWYSRNPFRKCLVNVSLIRLKAIDFSHSHSFAFLIYCRWSKQCLVHYMRGHHRHGISWYNNYSSSRNNQVSYLLAFLLWVDLLRFYHKQFSSRLFFVTSNVSWARKVSSQYVAIRK